MDQPIRTRRKDLPPDQPAPRPGTPPDPSNPELDSDVINTPLPGDDAPAPDLDQPRERVDETVQPHSTGADAYSRELP